MNWHPIILGALSGALSAARIDYVAFQSWQSFHDFAIYDWRTAAFRWLQGAIVGAVGASGFTALLG